MRNAFVRGVSGVLLAGLRWGCAPLSEEERFERTERLYLAREEYLVREQKCQSRGGVMQMRTHTLRKPGDRDDRAATCVRR